MGQSKAIKGTVSGNSKVMSPLSPMGMLFGGGIGRALGGGGVAKASVSPSTSSSAPSSASGTSSPFRKQESFGINSITSPFGGLRGGAALKRRTPWEGDIDLPGTSVGLAPGSEDKEEEDTIKAPTINDEEKRREAVDKANDFKVTVSGA